MKMKLLTVACLSALGLVGCGSDDNNSISNVVKSVDFTETPAPATTDELAKTYTRSVAKVTYADGRVEDRPLTYNVLFSVKDPVAEVNGKKHPAGQLYNYQMEPLLDPMGNPVVAETPDANSLLKVDGKLFLVTHYEYDWILSDGSVAFSTPGWYTRMPMSMTLSDIAQASDGQLTATKVRPIDFSGVNGIWIPCFGSQTPWNTHLGSEEDYDLIYNPLGFQELWNDHCRTQGDAGTVFQERAGGQSLSLRHYSRSDRQGGRFHQRGQALRHGARHMGAGACDAG